LINLRPFPLILSLPGKTAASHLATTSSQVVVESSDISPEPLLHTEQLQLPQLLCTPVTALPTPCRVKGRVGGTSASLPQGSRV